MVELVFQHNFFQIVDSLKISLFLILFQLLSEVDTLSLTATAEKPVSHKYDVTNGNNISNALFVKVGKSFLTRSQNVTILSSCLNISFNVLSQVNYKFLFCCWKAKIIIFFNQKRVSNPFIFGRDMSISLK